MDLLSRLRRKTWAKSREGAGSSRHEPSSRSHGHHFFRLPPELRDMIYTELLTRPHISEIWLKYEYAVGRWIDMTPGPGCRYLDTKGLTTSLLLVNRAMYKEASRILYRQNTLLLIGMTCNIIDFILSFTPWTRSVIRSLRLWIGLCYMFPWKLCISPNPRYRQRRQRKRPPAKNFWRHYRNGQYALDFDYANEVWGELLTRRWKNPDTSRKIYREVIENDTYYYGPVKCLAFQNDDCLEWSHKSPHSGDHHHDVGWHILRRVRVVLRELDFREESITIHPLNRGLPFDSAYVFMAVRGKNFRAT